MRLETEQNYLADDCECTEDIGGKGCMLFLMIVLLLVLTAILSISKIFK